MKLKGYLHGQTLKGVSEKFEKMGFSLNKKLSSKEISILDKINGGVIERVRIKRDLIHYKRSSEYLSWTKDLEALYNEIFPKQKIENNSIKFFKSPERRDADYFLEEQMKRMLQWFDEAIKEMPEHSLYIRETKEKILLECEALVENMEVSYQKNIENKNKDFHNNLYSHHNILEKQKNLILKWFDRFDKNITDYHLIDSKGELLESKEARKILSKAKENIIKEYDSLMDLKNILDIDFRYLKK